MNTDPLATQKNQEAGNVTDRRRSTNTTILQAHLNVMIGVKDKPNALLFKTAIVAINKELEPTLGENANRTHDFIFEGFDNFRTSVLEANKPRETP